MSSIEKQDQSRSDKFHYELKSKKEEICDFQALIYKLLPNSVASDIFAMALHEIIVNAAEHGNQMSAAKKIIIDIEVNKDFLSAEVEDEGDGFNWKKKLKQVFNIECEGERGRGIMMTKKACDKFYYNEKGNKAYLFKKIIFSKK
ncbi:MAG: ATP-binding protein [Halanaerobium sp.]